MKDEDMRDIYYEFYMKTHEQRFDFKADLAEALKEGYSIDYAPIIPFSTDTETLLHCLIRCMKTNDKYYDGLRFMLNNGANVNIKNRDKHNVLLSCIDYHACDIPLNILRDIVSKTEDLELAADNLHYEYYREDIKPTAFLVLATYYITFGSDGDDRSINEENAKNDVWEKIKILIDAGANYNIDEKIFDDKKGNISRVMETVRELKERIVEYVEYKNILQEENRQDLEMYGR